MNFNFNKKINNFLKIILKNALSQNLRVFFVGGIVRDNILNIPTIDIDLLLQGNAIEFASSLSNEIKIKSIHKDFCTVKLEYDDIIIDIASSRIEFYPHSGCLPIVKEVGIPIEKDVKRRDFSINSLYCELKLENEQIHYSLIDYVDGIEDIKNKTLKVLHDKSYIDDPTRIIRGLGFKYRFNFDFSDNDKKLINQYLNNINYENMSIDRNKKVIKQVLNTAHQQELFKELIEKKYYKLINSSNLQVDYNLIDSIFNDFTLDMVSMSELYLKIIINNDIEKISFANTTDIYKTFSKFNQIDLMYYYYKTKDENVKKYLKIKDIRLNISGNDLIKKGFKEGALIGEILNKLLEEKFNNPEKLNSKKNELEWVLKNYHKN